MTTIIIISIICITLIILTMLTGHKSIDDKDFSQIKDEIKTAKENIETSHVNGACISIPGNIDALKLQEERKKMVDEGYTSYISGYNQMVLVIRKEN